MADLRRRRRRSRHQPTATGDPEPTRDDHRRSRTDQTPHTPQPKTDPVPQPPPHPTPPDSPRHHGREDDDNGERGLRGLIGAGSSQVNPATALRARDAARPTPDDLATAERELTLIRRHWVPR